ncbi:hypothetical protein ACHAWX_001440 [Stephanocyclus meneghinianus]
MTWNNEYFSWKSTGGAAAPSESPSSHRDDAFPENPLLAVLIPRPTAWVSVYPVHGSHETSRVTAAAADTGAVHASIDDEPLVCLIEGYCGASDRPPTLMLGSDSIAPTVLEGLRTHRLCTLSVTTERDWRRNRPDDGDATKNIVQCMAACCGENCGPAKTFCEAGLKPCFPSSSLQSTLDSLPHPILSPSSKMTNNDGDSRHDCRQLSHCNGALKRPPAVESSPVQMHCRLIAEVDLLMSQPTHRLQSTMILLQVDTYVIHPSILREQTTLYPNSISIQGNPDVRKITAKIDCLLLSPLASLGNGKFGSVRRIYHMGRPRPKILSDQEAFHEDTCNRIRWEDCSKWEIDNLVPTVGTDNAPSSDPTCNSHHGNVLDGGTPITFTYRLDPYCPLGYNPMKQVVCPRFIGWISTYEPSSLQHCSQVPIAHISPYSFFIDVARGSRPMVAFAACPRTDELVDSDNEDVHGNHAGNQSKDGNYDDIWKDAQRDAERTGCFCVNFVSEKFAWAMNASAAPLGRGLSEFRLMESARRNGVGGTCDNCNQGRILEPTIPTYTPAPFVNAPTVTQSPAVMECKYVKTAKIPDIFNNDSMYSLIVGEVLNIHVRRHYAIESTSKNERNQCSDSSLEFLLDPKNSRPVARLGYGQEYTVIEECLRQT